MTLVRSRGRRVLPDLRTRSTERERMDDPHVDLALLDATYRQFDTVNALVGRWRHLYARRIRPVLLASALVRPAQTGPATLLDLGSGGGDIARHLAAWARRDGIDLHVTGIDPDARAHAFASARPADGVRFEQATSADLVAAGRRFDVVVSNHVLHHLDDAELAAVVRDSAALATHLALHADLERALVPHVVFDVATAALRSGSLLHDDGTASIRRSHRADELQALVASADDSWRVERLFPFRLLLVLERGRLVRGPRPWMLGAPRSGR